MKRATSLGPATGFVMLGAFIAGDVLGNILWAVGAALVTFVVLFAIHSWSQRS